VVLLGRRVSDGPSKDVFAVLFLVQFSLHLSDTDPLPNNQANQDHCKDGPDDTEHPNVDLIVTHPE
jgi:hypothetical protein